MARKLRIQFPGAIYHVMSRGNRREDIFRDDFDHESFLKTLADTCAKTGWQVHAFCLMPNHFHLVVETPQPNLVAGMKWFLGTYTVRFNRRHKLSGHVFAGRYKSLLVGGEGGYLLTVCDYVHLNPVRAKLLPPEAPLRSYKWSSFPTFLVEAAQRAEWLRVDRIFGECGIPQDTAAGRREFERRLELRRSGETAQSADELDGIRSAWCLGDDSFRKELLAQMDGKFGASHYGSELQEAAEAKASRIVDQELGIAKWTENQLRALRKGDPGKIRIARRLRAETTTTLQWIAARLHMGTRTHLSHLLYWSRRAELAGDAAKASNPTIAKKTLLERGGSKVRKAQSEERVNRGVEMSHPGGGSAPQERRVTVGTPETGEFTLPRTDPSGVGGFDTSFD